MMAITHIQSLSDYYYCTIPMDSGIPGTVPVPGTVQHNHDLYMLGTY